MFIGLFLILLGVLILLKPVVLVYAISGFFIVAGVTVMSVAWQFRRMRRQAQSGWTRWIARY